VRVEIDVPAWGNGVLLLPPRRVIATGEGGMLTTSDPDQDRKLRLWRMQWTCPRITFGFNYRMTDMKADSRARHAARYRVLARSPDKGSISLRLPFARTAAIRSRALLSSVDALPIHR
jgi:DegT/DnrJ/EryC1/StrS aminotransferase family